MNRQVEGLTGFVYRAASSLLQNRNGPGPHLAEKRLAAGKPKQGYMLSGSYLP